MLYNYKNNNKSIAQKALKICINHLRYLSDVFGKKMVIKM